MDYITVDSCHSRWIFDTEHRHFRRILKGLAIGANTATTDWRDYHELDFDPDTDSFVVVLDDTGTRVLRSWRHTGMSCPQCGHSETEELSVDDIAQEENVTKGDPPPA